MNDLEIIALINAEIAGYARDYKKNGREITALLCLKVEIEQRINSALNGQAEREIARLKNVTH